ncbi:MAG: hypothetical protein D6785_02940 [Planctomycetota bacterium]|nr:MAG: hypothetical protein D6785_02940 [Planctomycetota bacterium]
MRHILLISILMVGISFGLSCATSASLEMDKNIPQETSYGKLAIKGKATGSEFIKIRLKVKNQKKEEVLSEFKPTYKEVDGSYKWQNQVPLPKLGENEVIAEVVGRKGEVLTQKRFRIRRRRPAIFAVIIGINHYKNKKMEGKARYALQDARAFQRYITNYLGVNPVRVTMVLNEKATLRNIRHILGVQLPQKIQRDDMVFLYWAGCGITESLRSNQTTRYLLCYDSSPERLYSTALPWNELKQVIIPKIGARRIVMVGDLAFDITGDMPENQQRALGLTSGGKFIALKGGNRGELEEILLKAGGYGMAFIMPQALSYDDPSLTHFGGKNKGAGAFTYYVLKGMMGEADGAGGGRKDGVVEVFELLSYLQELQGIPENLKPMQELYVNGEMFVGAVKSTKP